MSAIDIMQSAWQDVFPENLNMAESLLWYQARVLSLLYKAGEMPLDVGKKLKQQYVSLFMKNQTTLEMQRLQIEEHANRWKEMEPILSDYRKEPTLENANKIIDIFYGLEH